MRSVTTYLNVTVASLCHFLWTELFGHNKALMDVKTSITVPCNVNVTHLPSTVGIIGHG